jgi:hypothetical protein
MMTQAMPDDRDPRPDAVGLCATCRHAAVIVSDRGSRFYRCERSKTDPRFPRYPALPVVNCIGYDEEACIPSAPRD